MTNSNLDSQRPTPKIGMLSSMGKNWNMEMFEKYVRSRAQFWGYFSNNREWALFFSQLDCLLEFEIVFYFFFSQPNRMDFPFIRIFFSINYDYVRFFNNF